MNNSKPKYHFYQWVNYKNDIIPYLVIRVLKRKDPDKAIYSIVRIDKQHKFLSEKKKTFEDFVYYGFGIKNEVNEEDLSSCF